MLVSSVFRTRLLIFRRRLATLPILVRRVATSHRGTNCRRVAREVGVVVGRNVGNERVRVLVRMGGTFARRIACCPNRRGQAGRLFPPSEGRVTVGARCNFVRRGRGGGKGMHGWCLVTRVDPIRTQGQGTINQVQVQRNGRFQRVHGRYRRGKSNVRCRRVFVTPSSLRTTGLFVFYQLAYQRVRTKAGVFLQVDCADVRFSKAINVICRLIGKGRCNFRNFVSRSICVRLRAITRVRLVRVFFMNYGLRRQNLLIGRVTRKLACVRVFSCIRIRIHSVTIWEYFCFRVELGAFYLRTTNVRSRGRRLNHDYIRATLRQRVFHLTLLRPFL